MRHTLLCMFLLSSTPALADSLVGHVALRSLQPPPGMGLPLPEISLDAIVTLEPTADPVWVQRFATSFNLPGAYRITSLNGTFNGLPTVLEEFGVPFDHIFSWALPSRFSPSRMEIGLLHGRPARADRRMRAAGLVGAKFARGRHLLLHHLAGLQIWKLGIAGIL